MFQDILFIYLFLILVTDGTNIYFFYSTEVASITITEF